MTTKHHTFIIESSLDGMRLDKALACLLSPISRSRIQSLIEQQEVAVDGAAGKWGSSKVRNGMVITVKVPERQDPCVLPENIPLNIVFEDEHLVVVDKPASMVVHPTPTHSSHTLVNALLFHFNGNNSFRGVGDVSRPGIVHRIDKDTSGLLVVAKTDVAHQNLSKLFKMHAIERVYSAYIWGRPRTPGGTIDAPIGRNKKQRQKMTVVEKEDPTGKRAITHYKTKATFKEIATHMECTLETGRTHQIRVHMATYHHGIIGDPVYGRIPKNCRAMLQKQKGTALESLGFFHRQALHAKVLGFTHPITKKPLYFESALPKDMQKLDILLRNF